MLEGLESTFCLRTSPLTYQFATLDYAGPSCFWLQKLRDQPYPFALQSAQAPGQRYDFYGASPHTLLSVKDGRCRITTSSGKVKTVESDPWQLIDELIVQHRVNGPYPADLPFAGGAVGYFGYELAYGLERLPQPVDDELDIPDLLLGFYDWFIAVDHQDQQAHLVATSRVSDIEFERIRLRIAEPLPLRSGFYATSQIDGNMTRETFMSGVTRIKSYIGAGDCYQVNLAQRFSGSFEGDPASFYADLIAGHAAPYSACLLGPDVQILSFSPERFLRVQDGEVVTQPIKGTRPRGLTGDADHNLAMELQNSEKDKAENLMIVDLLRNDLGKCCTPGTIKVDGLFELRSFANVHHLESTITGQLREGVSPIELLRNCFPGGSITGAPKVRAMQIIRELEPSRRGPYCGAIGYYSYNGNMDTNLSIRTMACSNGRFYYWGGGGVVADSTPEGEYQETLDKVDFLAQALGRQCKPAARWPGLTRAKDGTVD